MTNNHEGRYNGDRKFHVFDLPVPLGKVPAFSRAGIARMSDIKRVDDLADRLAKRISEGVENGTISADELRDSPDLTLVTNAARLLRGAGAELPSGLRRLAENAAAASAGAKLESPADNPGS
jgi:hypothetical protein